MTKAAFQDLLAIIRQDIRAHNNRGRPIAVDIQLLLTLRFYATGTFQLACGDLCQISQPSASRIIKRVSEAIACLKNNYINFPTANILQQNKLDFWRIGGLPNVIAAIDCNHIKIPSPGDSNAELYQNRKGYFSINAQVVCGPNLEIQNIVTRWPWPGSVLDARIFYNSRLCAKFERGDIPGNFASRFSLASTFLARVLIFCQHFFSCFVSRFVTPDCALNSSDKLSNTVFFCDIVL